MTVGLVQKLSPNNPYGKSSAVAVLAHIVLVVALILLPPAAPVKPALIVTSVEIVPVPPQPKVEVPKPPEPVPAEPAPVPEQVTKPQPQPQSEAALAPLSAAVPGETSANSVALESGTGTGIPNITGLLPENPPGTGSGGGGSAPASPTYRPKPNYPSAARAAGWEGTVVVRIRINTDGSVTVLSVREGSRDDACAAAADVVATWRYSPARDDNGMPISSVKDVRVKFDLKES